MSTRRYTAAIIGCGRIAASHMAGFRGNGRCDVTACADVVPEACKSFAAANGIPAAYTDYRAMLDELKPEIVSVCTQHHLHFEMVLEAAKRGPKGIYCEKPIALHPKEAQAMIDVCRERGVVLVVGHQRRYGLQYRKAKELLDGGAIGELLQMEAYGHPWSSLLVDGTHSLDLLRYYNGDAPAQWVFGQIDAKSGSHRFGHPNEGASMALIYFANGVRATLTTGGISPSGAPYPSPDGVALGADVTPEGYHTIVLHGTRGKIEIDGDAEVGGRPIVRVRRGADVQEERVPGFREASPIVPLIGDLILSIDTGAAHPLDGASAKASLDILSAVYESSKERTPVRLNASSDTNALFELIRDQQP